MFEVIVNPNGASGSAIKTFRKVEKLLKEMNVSYQVHRSTIEHDLDVIARELTSEKKAIDLLVLGGDGTLNKIINGIEDLSQVNIGYIPCGSGNDFARALRIPKDIKKNLTNILKKKQRLIDIGEVTYKNQTKEATQKFIVSSGIGFDAAICERADRSSLKKYLNTIGLGKLIYVVSAIQIIFHTERIHSKVKVDDKEVFDGQMLASVCMNSCYEGGGFEFCPKAIPFDQQLDTCIFGDLSRFDFFRIFPFAINGKHTVFKRVNEYRLHKLEVKTDAPMWLHTDGEVLAKSNHVIMKLHKHQLNIYN